MKFHCVYWPSTAFLFNWMTLILMAQLIWPLGDSSFCDSLPLPLTGETIISFFSWGPLTSTVSSVKAEILLTQLSILNVKFSTRHTIDAHIVAPEEESE